MEFSKMSRTHRRRPKVKNPENKLQSELKNIKNYFFENFKNLKITPKTPKNKKITTLESHVRSPLMIKA